MNMILADTNMPRNGNVSFRKSDVDYCAPLSSFGDDDFVGTLWVPGLPFFEFTPSTLDMMAIESLRNNHTIDWDKTSESLYQNYMKRPKMSQLHKNEPEVSLKSFETLRPNKWLDDTVVDAYMNLLNASRRTRLTQSSRRPFRSWIFSAFFYPGLEFRTLEGMRNYGPVGGL